MKPPGVKIHLAALFFLQFHPAKTGESAYNGRINSLFSSCKGGKP